MTDSKFWISVVVAFILAMGGSFLIHGMFLYNDYQSDAVKHMMRPEADAQNYFLYMLLAHVFIAVAITWIYRQGRSTAPWMMQGIRFGIAMACMTAIPMYLIYYAVQPWPGMIVAKQIIGDFIMYVILGIVVAAINKTAGTGQDAV